MTEYHPEELPETSIEPVSEHETAVAAAVPLDELVLRILDEQAAFAVQQQRILYELGRLDHSGAIAGQLRTLQHDVTVLSGLVPTVAHAQTGILDQITALRADLRALGKVLAAWTERLDAIEDYIERREPSRLTSAQAPR